MNKFKDQFNKQSANAPRVAILPVNPETPKPTPAATVEPAIQTAQPPSIEPVEPTRPVRTLDEPEQEAPSEPPRTLTLVDTTERPRSLSSSIFPSRHKQLKDLAYIEDRDRWKIIEDALEEYAVRHYGKQYRRK